MMLQRGTTLQTCQSRKRKRRSWQTVAYASVSDVALRKGVTLLEVVLSLAIFMVALAALNQLVNIGSERALQVQLQAKASLICQSKLAEMTVGAEAMSGAGWSNIDGEDEGWQWRADANENMAGLYTVRVTVKFETPTQMLTQCTLGQMVLDPTTRGSTMDPPPGMSSGSSGSGMNKSGSSDPNSESGTNSGSTGSGTTGGTTTGGTSSGGTTSGGTTSGGTTSGGTTSGGTGGSAPTTGAPGGGRTGGTGTTPAIPSIPALPTQGGKK